MTKKLLGLAVLALLCVGMASASTLSYACSTPGGSVPGPGTPTLTATETCAAQTLTTGWTITGIDLYESGDWQLGNPGSNTLVYSMTFGGAVSGSSTETVSGSFGASTAPFVFTGACTEVGSSDQGDCSFAGTGTNAVGAITTAWSGAWNSGSAGLNANGNEGVSSIEVLTYNTGTPEPAAMSLVGLALLGLGAIVRKGRKA